VSRANARASSAQSGSGTAEEADLSITLGGYAAKSWVTLSARQTGRAEGGGRTYQVTVKSWRVQICDRYDWVPNALAVLLQLMSDEELEGLPFPEGRGGCALRQAHPGP
jgi:hypothetical protein